MQLNERELHELASEVDDMHRASMRTFKEETADLHVDAVRARRRFITGTAGVAAVGAAVLLPGLPARLAAARGLALDDATIAGYAQGVELAAVAVYTMAAPLLTAATKPVADLFMKHHQEHAAAFGAVAGSHATTTANAKLVAALGPSIAGLKTEKDALEFAFVVEGQAAYTYAAALTLLQDPKYAAATATILPIEAQHQVVLGLALGKSVTDVFPTGAFESSALGDGTDPLKGLDPAVFA
jgi:Ferritin-like domain